MLFLKLCFQRRVSVKQVLGVSAEVEHQGLLLVWRLDVVAVVRADDLNLVQPDGVSPDQPVASVMLACRTEHGRCAAQDQNALQTLRIHQSAWMDTAAMPTKHTIAICLT